MKYKGYQVEFSETLNCYMVFCGWEGTYCFETIEDAKDEVDTRVKNRETYERLVNSLSYPRYPLN